MQAFLQPIVAFFVSLIAFGAVDAVWLTLAGKRLYQPVIGELLAPKVQVLPAVLFYVVYWVGVTTLATLPGLREGSVNKVAGTAAIMGLVAYATYDFTNQATLKAWAWKLTIADLLWGTFATTLAAVIGFYVTRAVIRT